MTSTFSRRALMRGMVGGAVGLALAPSAFSWLGPPPGKIALRFNENPYGPSPAAQKAAAEATALGAYYAVSIDAELKDTISAMNGLERDNTILSSGSNEALQAAYLALGKRGRIVMPALTYTDHIAYSRRMGVELETVPLLPDLSIDLDRIADAVDDGVSAVYICNPNNPTGLTIDGDTLRDFCRTVGSKTLVIVDEAYNEITDKPGYTSMVDLVRDGDNVIVMRTFSKIFGMAGMRVGYGFAQPDNAKMVNDYLMAWPNVTGLAAALASITDDEFIRFSRSKIHEGRDMVNATFRENGIDPVPSQTNFVFADIGRDASAFAENMAERDVLIRGGYPGHPDHVRVSMGRIEDIEVFQEAFTEIYNA